MLLYQHHGDRQNGDNLYEAAKGNFGSFNARKADIAIVGAVIIKGGHTISGMTSLSKL